MSLLENHVQHPSSIHIMSQEVLVELIPKFSQWSPKMSWTLTKKSILDGARLITYPVFSPQTHWSFFATSTSISNHEFGLLFWHTLKFWMIDYIWEKEIAKNGPKDEFGELRVLHVYIHSWWQCCFHTYLWEPNNLLFTLGEIIWILTHIPKCFFSRNIISTLLMVLFYILASGWIQYINNAISHLACGNIVKTINFHAMNLSTMGSSFCWLSVLLF